MNDGFITNEVVSIVLISFRFYLVSPFSGDYIAFTKVTGLSRHFRSLTLTNLFQIFFARYSILTSIHYAIQTTNGVGVTLADTAAPEGVGFTLWQNAFGKTRCKENMPGSQPQEINAALPPSLAALLTFSKCSGMRAWVSKLSITVKCLATIGVCSIKSVAEPPQRTITSILPLKLSNSLIA